VKAAEDMICGAIFSAATAKNFALGRLKQPKIINFTDLGILTKMQEGSKGNLREKRKRGLLFFVLF
jgi:hypothetical protein